MAAYTLSQKQVEKMVAAYLVSQVTDLPVTDVEFIEGCLPKEHDPATGRYPVIRGVVVRVPRPSPFLQALTSGNPQLREQ